MVLEDHDILEFFRLHTALMFYVNQQCGVLKGNFRTPDEYFQRPMDERIRVHDALLERRELIDAFVRDNPLELPEKDLAVIAKWKHLVAGNFMLLRQLRKHAIFLSGDSPAVAYGVVALMEPFDDVVGRPFPVRVKATLLPYKDRIIYDGAMRADNLFFGPGIRRRLNEEYNEAKAALGIVTTLPVSQTQTPPAAPTAKKRPARRKTGGKGAGCRGTWQVVSMSPWSEGAVAVANSEGYEAVIEFGSRQSGEIRIGEVQCEVDYREGERDGRPAVEFSFVGNDGTDEITGRGWAVREGEELRGTIYVYRREELEFVARKE